METFESKTQALARQCFHFQNGLNPSFVPTQQKPNRALTESSADQFYLIRQLNFQKLDLASQFLFARYFLGLAREVVPLYWHCLVMHCFIYLIGYHIGTIISPFCLNITINNSNQPILEIHYVSYIETYIEINFGNIFVCSFQKQLTQNYYF
ncbi:Hypothetical_protein [Hexamita inflata]|uniref:Hypothetical_protein n=1 Tax=Hexamita inflata TaxID=28002 RepID=A0AA86QJ51_9EUKA|nr:Hypothetical protein HINF_LOCUS44756 [Hexamita inflata]